MYGCERGGKKERQKFKSKKRMGIMEGREHTCTCICKTGERCEGREVEKRERERERERERGHLLTAFGAKRPAVVTVAVGAAVLSGTFGFGMGRVPKAIPTMAVMCVSGPNTCMFSPSFCPTSLMTRSPSW